MDVILRIAQELTKNPVLSESSVPIRDSELSGRKKRRITDVTDDEEGRFLLRQALTLKGT